MYAKILIPTDGSELANQAVTKGLELARTLGAEVVVLTVVEPFHVVAYGVAGDAHQLQSNMRAYEAQTGAHANQVLQAAEARAAEASVPVSTRQLQSDQPAEAIVRAAEEAGADLIVMASHGRRGVAALVLGSQTTRVLTQTRIPVLVLR